MISSLGKFVKPTTLLKKGTLKAGDIIEVDRIIYSHWVLFVGRDEVVHVGDVNSDIPLKEATVIKNKLGDVAGRSLVRINNKKVPARERGITPLPCDVIVENALRMVGKQVAFNLMTMNSEHYVTLWKYGDMWSNQADAAFQGVFSSSPQTDPTQAHKTMFLGIKSLLHFAQHPEQREATSSPGHAVQAHRKRGTHHKCFVTSLSEQLITPKTAPRESTL